MQEFYIKIIFPVTSNQRKDIILGEKRSGGREPDDCSLSSIHVNMLHMKNCIIYYT
jgi:hypothetical protein